MSINNDEPSPATRLGKMGGAGGLGGGLLNNLRKSIGENVKEKVDID